MTDLQEKYAEKIAKLLAKAESTTPAEAELLLEKAQSLMSQYAVDGVWPFLVGRAASQAAMVMPPLSMR